MGMVTCTECRKEFPENDVVTIQNAAVCAECKPIALQRVKEGVGTNASEYEYGGFWLRFGAKIIDGIVTSFATYALNILTGLILGSIGAQEAYIAIINFIVSFVIGIGYYTWMTGKFSATLGKMACGLKVIMSDGTRINYTRSCGRYFAEILSSLILCIGYIMAASDAEKRTLHDRICNTRVIKK